MLAIVGECEKVGGLKKKVVEEFERAWTKIQHRRKLTSGHHHHHQHTAGNQSILRPIQIQTTLSITTISPINSKCHTSLAAADRNPRLQRRSLPPKQKSTWSQTCSTGKKINMRFGYSSRSAIANSVKSRLILLPEMPLHRLPRTRTKQGRRRMPRSMRVKVLRGQLEGFRKDAGRQCRQTGWRIAVWLGDLSRMMTLEWETAHCII